MPAHMKEQVVKTKTRPDFSKQLISDIRWLLWAVTMGGPALDGAWGGVLVLSEHGQVRPPGGRHHF